MRRGIRAVYVIARVIVPKKGYELVFRSHGRSWLELLVSHVTSMEVD